MSNSQRKILGFVAFRKGSQRLSMKNGACIGDKPLYRISLDKLVELKTAGKLDAVVASTDSEDWAERCRQFYGGEVIIHERSAEVSDAFAGEGDVIQEFLSKRPEYKSYAVLLLLCTYPFMKRSVLLRLVESYQEFGESVFAVTESHHMPQKLLRVKEDQLKPYFYDSFDEFEPNTKILKEKYPIAYHSTGAFLFSVSGLFHDGMSVWNQPLIRSVIDDSFHIDVDTENDLRLARLHYQSEKNYGD